MTNPHPQPTATELEILQILWQHGPSKVRFVHEVLAARRAVGYTTTLKLMQIMHEKDLLHRNDRQRTHIYRAAVEEEPMQKQLLSRFLQATYRGNAGKMVVQTLGQHQPSPKELNEIRALLDDMDDQPTLP